MPQKTSRSVYLHILSKPKKDDSDYLYCHLIINTTNLILFFVKSVVYHYESKIKASVGIRNNNQ